MAKTEQAPKRQVAIGLGFIFGIFGFHRFYIGDYLLGAFYFVFCWTYIPFLLGIIDAVRYCRMSDEQFLDEITHIRNRNQKLLDAVRQPRKTGGEKGTFGGWIEKQAKKAKARKEELENRKPNQASTNGNAGKKQMPAQALHPPRHWKAMTLEPLDEYANDTTERQLLLYSYEGRFQSEVAKSEGFREFLIVAADKNADSFPVYVRKVENAIHFLAEDGCGDIEYEILPLLLGHSKPYTDEEKQDLFAHDLCESNATEARIFITCYLTVMNNADFNVPDINPFENVAKLAEYMETPQETLHAAKVASLNCYACSKATDERSMTKAAKERTKVFAKLLDLPEKEAGEAIARYSPNDTREHLEEPAKQTEPDEMSEAELEFERLFQENAVPEPLEGPLPVRLKKEESAFFASPVRILQQKTQTDTHRGLMGTRLRVGGIPLYLGGSTPLRTSKEIITTVGEGTLVLTDRRIVLSGTKANYSIKLNEIVNIKLYPDSVQIMYEGRYGGRIYVVENPRRLCLVLNFLFDDTRE